jgi:6-phosphogluconolactonase (cycloisomerase 2 family)
MKLKFALAVAIATGSGLWLAACGGSDGGTLVPQTYTIGGTVAGLAANASVVLVNNGTDILTVSANGAFTFAKPVDPNGSYAVTVKNRPAGQNCVVTSGSGSAVMADVTSVAVTCADRPQYAYVLNNGDNTVSQFAIGTSGTLTPLSVATVATGNSPHSITVDPSSRYAYVANFTDNTISQYVIQSDGTLAPNTPATVATGNHPWAVTINPSETWAYVANSADNTISQFSVSASGALVATTMPPVRTGVSPWNITMSPDGKYVYVANHGTPPVAGMTISQYAVDAGTGALTPLNPATLPTAFTYPGGMAVDPTNSYAYLANINGNSVSQYGIGADGALSSLSPASVPAGIEPVYMAFDPTGRFAYVANYTIDVTAPPGTVSQYSVGSAGQLTPLAPATVAAGAGPEWIAFDAFGKYVYVVNLGAASGVVSEYAIGTDGTLTAIGTVNAGTYSFMIATAH